MLGVERQPALLQRARQTLMNLAQARDGGEEAERPAAGGQKQLPESRRYLAQIVAGQVVDDENLGLFGGLKYLRCLLNHRCHG